MFVESGRAQPGRVETSASRRAATSRGSSAATRRWHPPLPLLTTPRVDRDDTCRPYVIHRQHGSYSI